MNPGTRIKDHLDGGGPLDKVDPRLAWPAAIAAAAIARYGADSLRHRREGSYGYEVLGDADPSKREFLVVSEALTGFPVSDGNAAEVLINGDRIFPAMFDAIRSAQHSLNFQTYVYWRGDVARELSAAIVERANEDVECRVILDAVGAAKMDRGLIDDLRGAGVRVLLFRAPKPYAIGRLTNRSHRRILVADGEVGMTGGVGIAEEWTGDASGPEEWRDTHVRVEGPAVRGLQGAFAENWLEGTGEVLASPDQLPDPSGERPGGTSLQVVRSAAGVGDTNVEALYFLALASARSSIDLTAAYFAPRPPFVAALRDAAERGVRVRVLVPGPHIDKAVVRIAGRASYSKLIEAGVEVHEYQPTMLHAKTMVVDESWSSIGTVNFDNRSFQLHDEITLCALDESMAGVLTDAFEHDLTRSERITDDGWTRRPLHHRVAEASTRLLRREL